MTVTGMTDEARRFHDLIGELRKHPLSAALIVWTDDDTPEDIDPETVDWGAVEDRCCEIGSEVIWDTGTLKA